MNVEAGQCYRDGYGDCTGIILWEGRHFIDGNGRRFLPDGRMLSLEVDKKKDIEKTCGCGGKK